MQDFEFFIPETGEVVGRETLDGRIAAIAHAMILHKAHAASGVLLTIEVRRVDRLFCVSANGFVSSFNNPELPRFSGCPSRVVSLGGK